LQPRQTLVANGYRPPPVEEPQDTVTESDLRTWHAMHSGVRGACVRAGEGHPELPSSGICAWIVVARLSRVQIRKLVVNDLRVSHMVFGTTPFFGAKE